MLQVMGKDVAKCGYSQLIVILVQRYKGVCQQMPFFCLDSECVASKYIELHISQA